MNLVPPPEFSRPVLLAKVTRTPTEWRLTANPAECAALAARFDLQAIYAVAGRAVLERKPDGSIRLDAFVEAAVVQSCVVTLEPVPATVRETFALIFRPGIDDEEADRLAMEDPDGDLVEPMPADIIDLGEILAQQVSLALDPYPRAAGAAAILATPDLTAFDEPPAEGLAALARFKARDE